LHFCTQKQPVVFSLNSVSDKLEKVQNNHMLNIIQTRRSVRKFESKGVPDELIDLVLEKSGYSPSWANTQCWQVVVVRKNSLKKELSGIVSPKNPATRAVSDAPVVLAICGQMGVSGFYKNQVTTKFQDWMLFDLGIFSQTLSLSAHALGLGSVIVGLFDHDKAGRILKVPEKIEVVTLIPVGYPSKIPKPPKRKSLSEFVFNDTF